MSGKLYTTGEKMKDTIVLAIALGLGGVALVVVFGAVLALPVMWLWNGVLPNLFATAVIKPIDFWNAWGLLILCGLLFKGSSSSSN